MGVPNNLFLLSMGSSIFVPIKKSGLKFPEINSQAAGFAYKILSNLSVIKIPELERKVLFFI